MSRREFSRISPDLALERVAKLRNRGYHNQKVVCVWVL